jgi:FKBP-type peptidyl-prolyl cis-trans isomerase FklB
MLLSVCDSENQKLESIIQSENKESSMKIAVSLLLLLAWPLSAVAGESLDFTDPTTRTNYSLGYQIGGDFKRQGVEMNAEAVVQGIRDALEGAEPQMPYAEMQATLRELKQKVVADQREQQQKRETEIMAEEKAFMEANSGKPGVITTDSGLQYTVIETGSGKSPQATDRVTVHYRGTLVDGNEFDSSYKRDKPATFELDSVIKGWSEGLQLMKEGGKSRLFIPPELAYGHRGPLAHRALIFEVELLSVEEVGPETEP